MKFSGMNRMGLSRSHAQRGMALVAALFLIIVLAALGAFAVRLSSSQQQSINLSLLGDRALAAANSGVEFGANRCLRGNACGAATTVFPPLNLNQMALKGFTVGVTCTHTTPSINGVPYNVYELSAVAFSGVYGTPDYVSRRVSKTVSTVPVP